MIYAQQIQMKTVLQLMPPRPYSVAKVIPYRQQDLRSPPASSSSPLTERRGVSHCRRSRGRQNRHRLGAVRRGGRRRPTAPRRRRRAGRCRNDRGGLGRRQHGVLLVRVVQAVLGEVLHLGKIQEGGYGEHSAFSRMPNAAAQIAQYLV